MKMIKLFGKVQVILLISLIAISLAAVSSFAADKLIVKDAAGTTDVFTVDDTGKVEAKSIGVNTSSPITDFHVASDSGSTSRGTAVSQHTTDVLAPVRLFQKSRGTATSTVAVQEGDFLGWFNVQGYDGSVYTAPAAFGFKIDGPVSSMNIPTSLEFWTGTFQGPGGRQRNFSVSSTGVINFKNLEGTYSGGSAYLCVYDSGDVYASEVACP